MMSRYIRLYDALKAYDEAMDELVKWQMDEWQLGDFSECEFNTTDCKHIARKIADAPSIDIESKRGEWITTDTEVISVPVYWNEEQRQSDKRGAGILEKCECSVCGWRTNFMGYKKLGVNKSYNFCPNCGADMRERKDERDYL